jgi:hypothetical protein
MRAVKTVLTAAGKLKLKYLHEQEAVLVLRSIRDVNLPKFLPDDVPLFEGIISDLFSGVQLTRSDKDELVTCVKHTLKKMRLGYSQMYLERIFQVYDMRMRSRTSGTTAYWPKCSGGTRPTRHAASGSCSTARWTPSGSRT